MKSFSLNIPLISTNTEITIKTHPFCAINVMCDEIKAGIIFNTRIGVNYHANYPKENTHISFGPGKCACCLMSGEDKEYFVKIIIADYGELSNDIDFVIKSDGEVKEIKLGK